MSKHTEGPWEWADGTHALVGPKIDDKPVWLRPVVLRSETGVKAEDARLIAAAPQLLDALRAICDELDGQQGYATLGVYDKARAALAAATGAQAGEIHER